MSVPSVYIICGEASGDLHASNLAKALKKQSPGIRMYGTGGDRMAAQGVVLARHIRDMNFMGFVEVIANLRKILSILAEIKKDILVKKPDAVILVDYPGFNLRLAPWLKAQGIRVIYYISPQLWAWKKGRIETIRTSVDHMFVILPFEKEFYAEEGIEADFFGHPLMDAMDSETDFSGIPGFRPEKPVLAILPGSRKQEIRKILPEFAKAALNFPEFQPVIACAPAVSDAVYDQIPEIKGMYRVKNMTRELLHISSAAMVASGTATLETALAGIPQVVGYKAHPVSVFLARRLVQVKYISLVNLILDRPVLKELIQEDLSEQKLTETLRDILYNTVTRERMRADYADLREKLGGSGASGRIAAKILEIIS